MNQLNLIGHRLTGLIDRINDRFTSYRLLLYFLLALVGWATVGSLLDKVFYQWYEILISAGFLMAVCWLANHLIARYLDIPANKESPFITGLILALIIPPPKSSRDFALVAAAGLAAIAAKFLITVYKSHIFNPAAAGAFIAGEVFHRYPSWWVGTKFITPLVIIGGILILRKMKRFSLVGAFLAVYVLYLIYGSSSGGDLHFLWLELISTPVLFFAIVMLIEPLTSPSQASRYLPYAVLVGILYSVTKLGLSPEEALLIGNLFAFLIAANRRYELKFIRRIKEADGIYSYIFTMPQGFKFMPGQYMEWTIAQNKSDTRGSRRYFTIASSPTEPGVMFTVKHPSSGASAFKRQLEHLGSSQTILASDLSGNFVLPKDSSKKLAFLAGGVGITPFRSIVKYLIDTKQTRDIHLVYSANAASEFSFQNLFAKAAPFGLKSHYLTDRLDGAKIAQTLPDYKSRRFYVSGPYGFVNAVESALLKLKVPASQIVTDYFPGYGG